MSLYTDWKTLLENQTDDTFEAFWDEYCKAEMKIYSHILEHHDEHLTGALGELSEKFEVRPVIFEGFLDGIESSLKNGDNLDIESMTEDSAIDLDVDFEKLYYNMWQADAPHLYSLEAWSGVLDEDTRKRDFKGIQKSKKSTTLRKKPGRNDPCPCGSGKKYKKCCGR